MRTDKTLVTLAAHTLVGRSSACSLRLRDPRVSSEHARIVWRDERWQLHDLGSRNGTFINGERLERGTRGVLDTGDTLAFGDAGNKHVLIDASAPEPVARALENGEIIRGDGGLLVVPEAHEPHFCVYESDDGEFVVEHRGEVRVARDGDVIHLDDQAFMLHLPEGLAPTVQVDEPAPGVEDLQLRLQVSRDEEHVQVFVSMDGRIHEIPPRSHHYTLLTLARLRVGNDEQPDPVRGWVSMDELCRMLAAEETRLNVEIYRIRREINQLGVRNAAQLIERRRGTRMLRLGTGRVSIFQS